MQHSREGKVLAQERDVPVLHIDLCRRARKNVSILIAEPDPDDLIEGLCAHRPGVHSQAASEIAWDAFHPLKPGQPGTLGKRAELFKFDPNAGCNFFTGDLVA